jgi:subtilisin family serine protease
LFIGNSSRIRRRSRVLSVVLTLLSACGSGGSNDDTASPVSDDACYNYTGIQDSAEIASRGFVSDAQGICRLQRNHEALALSGVDRMLMEGWSGANVMLAIVDSGFRLTHESVAPQVQMVAAYSDANANYRLDSGEKVLDEAAPLVAAHGTAVTALAAGQGVGVAPGAGLWLKSLGDENPYVRDLAIATTDALANEGLGIINHSNSLYWEVMIYRNAANDGTGILPAILLTDAVVTSAAGNEGRDLSALLDQAEATDASLASFLDTPAEARHVLLVGALDRNLADLDDFSNFPGHRETVQARFLVAAGGNLQTASSGGDNEYRTVEGTSFATPLVSGAMAILQEVNPSLTPVEAADLLLQTAQRPSQLGYGTNCRTDTDLGSFDSDCGAMKFGAGIMDLPAAVARAALSPSRLLIDVADGKRLSE